MASHRPGGVETVTKRVRITIVYPQPWWRRLLRLPARREVRGPYVVEPWPQPDTPPVNPA
jgi:hypothetical protein